MQKNFLNPVLYFVYVSCITLYLYFVQFRVQKDCQQIISNGYEINSAKSALFHYIFVFVFVFVFVFLFVSVFVSVFVIQCEEIRCKRVEGNHEKEAESSFISVYPTIPTCLFSSIFVCICICHPHPLCCYDTRCSIAIISPQGAIHPQAAAKQNFKTFFTFQLLLGSTIFRILFTLSNNLVA